MGGVFPWTKTSIVRHFMGVHPHTNAYAVEQLAGRYGAGVWFSNRRVYISYRKVECSYVLPTLVLGGVDVLLEWLESLLKQVCHE